MKTKLTKFQCMIIAVAAGAFISQLSINAYYESHGSSVNLDDQMKREIAAFYKSPEYVSRVMVDSISTKQWSSQIAQKEKRNDKELDATGKIKYDESIRALTDSIRQCLSHRIVWTRAEVLKIEQRYANDKNFWLNRWGGFGLIFVFESLALAFGFIAPRRQKIYNIFGGDFRLEFWCAIAASLYAQKTSCVITEKGLALLLGDNEMAWAYSLAFMMLVPFFYWIGGMDIEERDKEPAMATITTREQTDSVELSRKQVFTERTEKVPVEPRSIVESKKPIKPTEWKDACRMIEAGELQWSERQVTREYPGVTWYKVRQEFDAIRCKNDSPSLLGDDS